jgi:hypothetical protein
MLETITVAALYSAYLQSGAFASSLSNNQVKLLTRMQKNDKSFVDLSKKDAGSFNSIISKYQEFKADEPTPAELMEIVPEPPAPPEQDITPIETVSQSMAEKIARETCILEVHRSEPGFQKKIDSSIVLNGPNEGVDPKRLYVTKALVDNKEIKELSKHRTKFFDDLKAMSLPSGLLTIGNGQYLISVAMVKQVKGMIDKYLSERTALLDDFEVRYPAIIESAKERLGPLFNAGDYPPFAQIRSGYSTSYRFVSNTVPEEIEKVSAEIYASEQERILHLCAGEVDFIQNSLRERFLDMVEHFSSRLGADEQTGKAKRFHGSNIEHLKDFVATFKQMNLTGDVVLEELVNKAEALVTDVDPTKVRSDSEFRAKLETSFNDIKAAADKLVVERKRKVILED